MSAQAIILISYIVYLILFIIFSAAAFYHCWEFGYIGDATKIMMSIYSVVVLVVVALTFFLILTI